MLYYLFQYLDKLNVPGAGVFAFISFRSAAAVITALLISMLIGKRIILFLQRKQVGEPVAFPRNRRDPAKRAQTIAALERQMKEAAANLEFEMAAMLRDQVNELRALDAPEVARGGGAAPRARRRA